MSDAGSSDAESDDKEGKERERKTADESRQQMAKAYLDKLRRIAKKGEDEDEEGGR